MGLAEWKYKDWAANRIASTMNYGLSSESCPIPVPSGRDNHSNDSAGDTGEQSFDLHCSPTYYGSRDGCRNLEGTKAGIELHQRERVSHYAKYVVVERRS